MGPERSVKGSGGTKENFGRRSTGTETTTTAQGNAISLGRCTCCLEITKALSLRSSNQVMCASCCGTLCTSCEADTLPVELRPETVWSSMTSRSRTLRFLDLDLHRHSFDPIGLQSRRGHGPQMQTHLPRLPIELGPVHTSRVTPRSDCLPHRTEPDSPTVRPSTLAGSIEGTYSPGLSSPYVSQ